MSGVVIWSQRRTTGRTSGGRLEARRETLVELVKDGLLSISEAAKRLSVSEAELRSLL